jgi:uncharacterized protein (TIGR02145 family)
MITIHLPGSDHLRVSVTNLFGQRVALFEQKLKAGSHSFIFYPGNDRYYVLSATTNGEMDAIKMINLGGQTSQSVSLHYQGVVESGSNYKAAFESKEFSFSMGDTLRFTGYANTPTFSLGSSEIEDVPMENQTYTFNIVEGIRCPGQPITTDIDGNIYNTVLIGDQCWMKENLKTTHYLNNTPIEYPGGNNNAWANNTTGAYAWPENNINLKDSYGALYNWHAVNNTNGLCPTGWHVPSDDDWWQLTDYVVAQGFPNLNEPNGAGNALKSCRQVDSPLGGECNTTEHPRWNSQSIHHGFDEFSFSGFPANGRFYSGSFGTVGTYGHWWSATESTPVFNAWLRMLILHEGLLVRAKSSKQDGYSVRCLRDESFSAGMPIVTTAEVTGITQTSAISGGNVTDDGGAFVTARGVVWSITANPTVENNGGITYDGTGTGEFISNLTGLNPETEYFVRAYATNIQGTAYGEELNFTTSPAGFACGTSTITDIDGNVYNTVLIGSQCWMKENLKVGTMINGSQNQTNNGTIEKYCYNNNTANCDIYGGLYQWNEMMGYSTTPGVQGICPPGWHIPTDDEWKILEGTVDSQYGVGHSIWNNTGWRGFDAGKNLKSTTGWDSGGNGTDLYGFGALPGGFQNTLGSFSNLGYSGHWWSSSESSGTHPWNRRLYFDYDGAGRNYSSKTFGFSVRCLKDN